VWGGEFRHVVWDALWLASVAVCSVPRHDQWLLIQVAESAAHFGGPRSRSFSFRRFRSPALLTVRGHGCRHVCVEGRRWCLFWRGRPIVWRSLELVPGPECADNISAARLSAVLCCLVKPCPLVRCFGGGSEVASRAVTPGGTLAAASACCCAASSSRRSPVSCG